MRVTFLYLSSTLEIRLINMQQLDIFMIYPGHSQVDVIKIKGNATINNQKENNKLVKINKIYRRYVNISGYKRT